MSQIPASKTKIDVNFLQTDFRPDSAWASRAWPPAIPAITTRNASPRYRRAESVRAAQRSRDTCWSSPSSGVEFQDVRDRLVRSHDPGPIVFTFPPRLSRLLGMRSLHEPRVLPLSSGDFFAARGMRLVNSADKRCDRVDSPRTRLGYRPDAVARPAIDRYLAWTTSCRRDSLHKRSRPSHSTTGNSLGLRRDIGP